MRLTKGTRKVGIEEVDRAEACARLRRESRGGMASPRMFRSVVELEER